MTELSVTLRHQSQRFDPAEIKSMLVLGRGGNDEIIDESTLDIGVTILGGAGNDNIKPYGTGRVIRGVGDSHRTNSRPLKNIDGGSGRDSIIANNGKDILSGKTWMHVRADGTAVVGGSAKKDRIFIAGAPYIVCTPQTIDCGHDIGHYEPGIDVSINGLAAWLPLGIIKRVVADLGGGNDFMSLRSLMGSDLPATIFGGQGDDTIFGGTSADSIDGEAGDDSILAGGGNDTVSGASGDDFIDGEEDLDTVFGGPGADTLSGETSHDQLFEGWQGSPGWW
jgi:Ca2+-binding RTX toxin-like protein